MMKLVSLYISVIVSAVLLPSVCIATEKFYVIAHMVNDHRSAGWALNSGANAVEIDINFDGNTGQPTRFHHGTPCDCTCLMEVFTGGSVCHLSNVCKGGADVASQFAYLRNFQALALIYIDSKTDKLSVNTRKKAGKAVVKKLETELFAKGYRGKVLIGSGSNKEYIVAAADQAKLSSYASKIYFTLDQDRSGAISTLNFLTSLSVPNIVYSTGISACATKTYYDDIKMAGINKDRGVVSNVFVWTLDKESSFDNYYTAGARGIITNKVPKLVAWARAKGLQLATPGDDSLPPATSKSIVRSLGSCDCDYHDVAFQGLRQKELLATAFTKAAGPAVGRSHDVWMAILPSVHIPTTRQHRASREGVTAEDTGLKTVTATIIPEAVVFPKLLQKELPANAFTKVVGHVEAISRDVSMKIPLIAQIPTIRQHRASKEGVTAEDTGLKTVTATIIPEAVVFPKLRQKELLVNAFTKGAGHVEAISLDVATRQLHNVKPQISLFKHVSLEVAIAKGTKRLVAIVITSKRVGFVQVDVKL